MSESGITVTLTANEHEAIQLAARGAHKLGLMYSEGWADKFRRAELEALADESTELRALRERILLGMTRPEYDAMQEQDRRAQVINADFGTP